MAYINNIIVNVLIHAHTYSLANMTYLTKSTVCH